MNDHDTATTTNTSIPEPGTYRARAIEWRWDTAKSGEPCLAILFELTSGQPGFQLDSRLYFDTEKQDTKGRTAMDRSMEALRALGLQGEALTAEMAGIDQGEVDLVCETNERGYLAVKWINAPRAKRELRTFAEPEAPTLNAFLAKVNGRARAMAAGARATGATRPTAGPPPVPVSPRPAPQQAQRAQPPSSPRQPPPRMQGQSSGEFGDDSDIPF